MAVRETQAEVTLSATDTGAVRETQASVALSTTATGAVRETQAAAILSVGQTDNVRVTQDAAIFCVNAQTVLETQAAVTLSATDLGQVLATQVSTILCVPIFVDDGAPGVPLTKVDTWELDHGSPTWPTDTGTPIAWWDTTLEQQKFGVAPAPDAPGTLGLLYIALANVLDGSGVSLAVPDDWSPYILWGTLAELLSSDGPAFDPVRAAYCQRRYDEGVELARLVLGGPSE